ncbi:MAG: MFS transporter [Methylococcales bacterium]|nr:MFS transporter [Methylococcales bacterium]MCK5924813.1 MFS transporter [Methylococcales bacterium]
MKVPYGRLSSFYFFYFSTFGLFLPYWNPYLKSEGFSALEMGELTALLLGTKIIAPNIFGIIADCTGKGLQIIRTCSFFAAFLFIGFFFKSGYLWFAVITFGFSFFWNACLPQFEALTMCHLKENPHQYSYVRLWGSIGFIVSVMGIGFLLENYGIDQLPLIATGLLVFIWLLSLMIPEVKQYFHEAEKVTGVWKIIKKPKTLAFLMVFMLLQAAHGPYYVFYSIYLEELGYSGAFVGRMWALAVVSEVIVLLFMKKLLACFSLRCLLMGSIFLSIIRWLMIGWFADSLYWVASAQLLNGLTFGISHVVAIHLVHLYFGDQHQGKGQALFSSISFGFGGMLGSFLSGHYWEQFEPEIIYSTTAAACVIALLFSFFAVKSQNYL